MPITVRRGIPGNQFICFALMVFCVMKFRYICYHTAWDYFKFDLLNLNWTWVITNVTTHKYQESVYLHNVLNHYLRSKSYLQIGIQHWNKLNLHQNCLHKSSIKNIRKFVTQQIWKLCIKSSAASFVFVPTLINTLHSTLLQRLLIMT